ncbi:MAG: hypothetical protein JWP98_149 [Edaphobacter sp.]|nr:hypothetical protein [Edaphobacter sp.]
MKNALTLAIIAITVSLSQLNQQISLPPSQIIALFQTANLTIPAASLALSCGNTASRQSRSAWTRMPRLQRALHPLLPSQRSSHHPSMTQPRRRT